MSTSLMLTLVPVLSVTWMGVYTTRHQIRLGGPRADLITLRILTWLPPAAWVLAALNHVLGSR